jgi:hypothetical protein
MLFAGKSLAVARRAGCIAKEEPRHSARAKLSRLIFLTTVEGCEGIPENEHRQPAPVSWRAVVNITARSSAAYFAVPLAQERGGRRAGFVAALGPGTRNRRWLLLRFARPRTRAAVSKADCSGRTR